MIKTTLAQLHHDIKTSPELAELLKTVAVQLHNRNISPMKAHAMYAGDDLNLLTKTIRGMMSSTDISSLDSIKGDEYQWFRHALDSGLYDIDRSLHTVLAYLLEEYLPGLDDYVQRIGDSQLTERLGLVADDQGLIELTDDMELRKFALILPKQNVMIYPHQFMRRFYSANFVYVPTILEHCRKQDCTVQLRIDPYRQSEPRCYREWMEADYWYGPAFSEDMLKSKDKEPVRTLHYARDDDRLQYTYPLSYTLFRSDMMSDTERQFAVEEYIPFSSPLSDGQSPGVGDKFVIQKFAHFVYDQTSASFSHIDGAVRVFTKEEYAPVLEGVKNGDPGKKVGKRHKLFKVSGSMNLELVQTLLYEFFRYNPHLGEYFASPEAVDAYARG